MTTSHLPVERVWSIPFQNVIYTLPKSISIPKLLEKKSINVAVTGLIRPRSLGDCDTKDIRRLHLRVSALPTLALKGSD